MIIRKIKPLELKKTMELFAIAFEYPLEEKRTPKEVYEDLLANPKSREDTCLLDKYAAFEDDDKTMFSYIGVTTFPMNFDGNEVKMAGVGGVSSLPSHRRRGGIRGCFNLMLQDIYREGYVFSCLYPFSTAYYSMFGYTPSGGRKGYELDLSFLKDMAKDYRTLYEGTDSRCILLAPENREAVLEDVKEVYSAWSHHFNGMVLRGDFEYDFVRNADPAVKQEFTYLCYDEKEHPIAYMVFKKVKEEGVQILECKEFIYVNAKGARALLALASGFAADHKYIRFYVPEYTGFGSASYTEEPRICPIEMLIPELSLGARKGNLGNSGMVRVVNVKEALRLARYKGDGELRIAIKDAQIEDNNGVFEVAYTDGRAVAVHKKSMRSEKLKAYVSNVASENRPDITISINDFSSLVFGVRDIGELYSCDKLKCDVNTLQKMEGVFYRKPVLTVDYF